MHFMRFAPSLLWVRLNVGTAAVTVLTVFLFLGSNKTVDGRGAVYTRLWFSTFVQQTNPLPEAFCQIWNFTNAKKSV
jgi:hypothetical protein